MTYNKTERSTSYGKKKTEVTWRKHQIKRRWSYTRCHHTECLRKTRRQMEVLRSEVDPQLVLQLMQQGRRDEEEEEAVFISTGSMQQHI